MIKVRHNLGHLFISGIYHAPFKTQIFFWLYCCFATHKSPLGFSKQKAADGQVWAEDWEPPWAPGRAASSRWATGRTQPTSRFCRAHPSSVLLEARGFTKPRTTYLWRSRKRGTNCPRVCPWVGIWDPPLTLFCRGFKGGFEYICDMRVTTFTRECQAKGDTHGHSHSPLTSISQGAAAQAASSAGRISARARRGKPSSVSKLLRGNKHCHREWKVTAKCPLVGIQTCW